MPHFVIGDEAAFVLNVNVNTRNNIEYAPVSSQGTASRLSLQ